MNLKIVLLLSLSHLCIDLTGGALPAVMPLLKEKLALTYAGVGSVIMLSNLTSSIIQPCFGYISDRVETKWVLPFSFLLTSAGFSFAGLAPSYFVLLPLIFISGLGVASYHPEGMKAMHFLSGRRIVTGMSFFQVGGNLGMALGPLGISFALKLAGLRGTLFYLIVGLSMSALLFSLKKDLSLSGEEGNGGSHEEGRHPTLSSSAGAGRWKAMSLLIPAVALRSWAHMGLVSYVAFYYINVLNGDPITAGRMVSVFLMGGVAGTLVGGVIADKINHKYCFLFSMILSVPLLFIFLGVSGFWFPVVLFLIGFVLISSFSITVVMGQRLLPDRLGMASGIMMGLVIGMGGLGAGLLGLVADAWGIVTVIKLIAIMPAIGAIPLLMLSYPPMRPKEASGSEPL